VQGATKDVAALKDKFKGLEQKLMELQQRLDAKEKENARLKEESQRQAYVVHCCGNGTQ
jgi:predicted nuclease with TOPRIM domain